ncbi:zinc finger, C2H2 type [Cooperia oncophora]
MRTQARCHVCLKGPFPLSRLYRHLRTVHDISQDEVKEVQIAIRKAMHKEKVELKCEFCGGTYYSDKGLSKHKRVVHGEARRPVKCPGCEFSSHTVLELANHCRNKHSGNGLSFNLETQDFKNWNLFAMWLSSRESATYSKLSIRRTWKPNDAVMYFYACNYFGAESCKRNKKETNAVTYCPCFVQVSVRPDATVQAVACFSHYGHPVNSFSSILKENDEFVEASIAGVVPEKAASTHLLGDRWMNVIKPKEEPLFEAHEPVTLSDSPQTSHEESDQSVLFMKVVKDEDSEDRAKETFHVLERVVAMILESGRSLMRERRFEEIERLNGNLFAIYKNLPPNVNGLPR